MDAYTDICITEEICFTITVKAAHPLAEHMQWPVLDVKLKEGKDDV